MKGEIDALIKVGVGVRSRVSVVESRSSYQCCGTKCCMPEVF